jgi:hypothetical protein
MLKKMRFRAKMTGELVLLLVAIAVNNPAQTRRTKQPDAATLRVKFVEAFGKDFDLVKDEMKTRSVASGGGTFWLASVKPKRTGYFFLLYSYRESFPIFSREHEFRLDVGAKGCRRGPPQSRTYNRFCLGDTVIIPVLVSDSMEHEFMMVRADYTDAASKTFDEQYPQLPEQKLNPTEVPNPAADSLRFIGLSSHKALHIIPEYTMTLNAVLKR